jgi:trehalose-phosphatase
MKNNGSNKLFEEIRDAPKLCIFLDYDGTLAEFAPTPGEIHPDLELIALLERLKNHKHLQVAIISGRRLSHIRALIPIPGITLAGTYGIELLDQSGTQINRVDFETIRPPLKRIKPYWLELIRPYRDFYLEDKGWSLALHAKFVDQEIAEEILNQARKVIDRANLSNSLFRILGGHKFLEVAPRLANKGLTVRYLISKYPLEGALPIYIGDDDKDEEAFEVVIQNNGIPMKVCSRSSDTKAQLRLDSPKMVRRFLVSLL